MNEISRYLRLALLDRGEGMSEVQKGSKIVRELVDNCQDWVRNTQELVVLFSILFYMLEIRQNKIIHSENIEYLLRAYNIAYYMHYARYRFSIDQ